MPLLVVWSVIAALPATTTTVDGVMSDPNRASMSCRSSFRQASSASMTVTVDGSEAVHANVSDWNSTEQTGIPVHIYHIKVRGKNNFGRVKEIIKKIDAARARGLDITANQYPYTAMEHPWARLFPAWVQEMPRKDAIPMLKERAFRDKIKADKEFAEYVNEHGGWEGIVGTVCGQTLAAAHWPPSAP